MLFCGGLYESIKNRIPELDSIVQNHGHILEQEDFSGVGGIHDIPILQKVLIWI
jgi:hypothetical protein